MTTDRFGNPLDARAGYAWGALLRSHDDEARRMLAGRALIPERVARLGEGAVYNLTGLIRAFPLRPEDLAGLTSQLAWVARWGGEAEDLAIKHIGGDPAWHAAAVLNRVSAAMLAVMLALDLRGKAVLSLIPGGRSHPSIGKAVALAGGTFAEVAGLPAFRDLLAIGRQRRPKLFDLTAARPPPLVPRRLRRELPERVLVGGRVARPLDLGPLAAIVDDFRREGIEALAVCFLHAYVNPGHERAVRDELAVEDAARGILSVVNANMVRAFRVVSVERGWGPRDFTLVAFGGAGPLHAADLARELGIRRVLVPPAPGVLCAIGLLTADLRSDASRTYLRTVDGIRGTELTAWFGEVRAQAEAAMAGPPSAEVEERRWLDMRYCGQNHELRVPVEPRPLADDDAVQLVYRRADLPAGLEVRGPAVVEQMDSTVVVPPGVRGGVHPSGSLLLEL